MPASAFMTTRTKVMRIIATAVAASGLCSASALHAAERNALHFEASPYLWAAGMKGSTGARGVEADIDVGFDDIVEDLDLGLMGVLELRKGNWLLLLDGVYMKLQDEKSRSWTGPGGLATATADLEVTPEMTMIAIAGGYRINADNVAVDVLGGARYTKVDMEFRLTTTTAGLFPGGVRTVSADESWWDPFVGVRIVIPFAEKWAGVLYADYGGFGVGSDSTYQVLAGVNWNFSKHFSAKLGYRYLYQDFEDDDNGFVWDMKAYGPYIGLGIRF